MVLDVFSLPTRSKVERGTPFGCVVISQTCDVVQPKSDAVILAAIIKLDEDVARQARKGARPRYVPLPGLGDEYFADLDRVAAIGKADLVGHRKQDGLDRSADRAERFFAEAVGRRFSRFAFPGAIEPHFAPLRDLVIEGYKRETSALYQALESVVQLRLESRSWDSYPTEITLHVIVKAGELPPLGDGPAVPSGELVHWLGHPRSAKQIAERLFQKIRPTGDDRQVLGEAFGGALAAKCIARAADLRRFPEATGAVIDVIPEVSSEDEFSLAQFRRSERLDLNYLSPPLSSERPSEGN